MIRQIGLLSCGNAERIHQLAGAVFVDTALHGHQRRSRHSASLGFSVPRVVSPPALSEIVGL
jgi:hypothetical protein